MTPKEIKKLRRKLKLTQLELSQKLKVTPTSVARWECGMNPPNEWHQHKLRELEKGA